MRLLTHFLEAFLVVLHGVGWHVTQNGITTQFPSSFRPDDQRIGLDLTRTEALQIILHVWLEVIRVFLIGEISAAARYQVVDPSESVASNEISVESKSVDDEIIRRPANRLPRSPILERRKSEMCSPPGS